MKHKPTRPRFSQFSKIFILTYTQNYYNHNLEIQRVLKNLIYIFISLDELFESIVLKFTWYPRNKMRTHSWPDLSVPEATAAKGRL